MTEHYPPPIQLAIEKLTSGLAQLCTRQQPVVIDNIFDDGFLVQLENELKHAAYFLEERWLLTASEDVKLVEKDAFSKADIKRRFSLSDSLREVYRHCYPTLRLLETIISSTELTSRFSNVWGSQVGCASIEVARYRKGHFLSEHADLFGQRVFAFV